MKNHATIGWPSVLRRAMTLVALLAVTTAGCAQRSKPSDGQDGAAAGSEKALRARAVTLWKAKEKEDWATVFEFEDPAERDASEKAEFIAWSADNEPFVISAVDVGDALVADGYGWVEVSNSTAMRRYPELPPRHVHKWEKWHYTNGDWYPVPLADLEDYPESPALRNAQEEDRLRERFKASWEARQQADWSRLYTMSDPRDHAQVSEEEFAKAMGMLDFVDCDVKWIEVIGTKGTVHVEVIHKLTDPSLTKLPSRSIIIDEEWVLVDGEWYLDLAPE